MMMIMRSMKGFKANLLTNSSKKEARYGKWQWMEGMRRMTTPWMSKYS
jgi:hypothetical protein